MHHTTTAYGKIIKTPPLSKYKNGSLRYRHHKWLDTHTFKLGIIISFGSAVFLSLGVFLHLITDAPLLIESQLEIIAIGIWYLFMLCMVMMPSIHMVIYVVKKIV